VFEALFHLIILSGCEFAGLRPWSKMKTSAFVQPRWFESMSQAIADRHKRKDARRDACVRVLHIRNKTFARHIQSMTEEGATVKRWVGAISVIITLC
jgi:hypothetical protein